jgi:predicted enzyme related to lactoylglutathione lyase
MGNYQLFTINGPGLCGIMSDSNFPRPGWLQYFRVDGIQSAALRIVEAGG